MAGSGMIFAAVVVVVLEGLERILDVVLVRRPLSRNSRIEARRSDAAEPGAGIEVQRHRMATVAEVEGALRLLLRIDRRGEREGGTVDGAVHDDRCVLARHRG